MAQDGDTITYAATADTPTEEDISNIEQATVVYCNGTGASGAGAAIGGRVEDATIDLSGEDTLYIWVANGATGRYDGQNNASIDQGGGSTEISFLSTSDADSSDEPFLVGAGGGGNGITSSFAGEFSGAGARGGNQGGPDGSGTADGVAPPAGGDGETSSSSAEPGDGAIDDQNRGLVIGGTTIKGGGAGPDTNGEVRISYSDQPLLSPPDPPSNLSAEVQ